MATRPKLSFSDALLSFFKAETPMANASIKGTVNAPVVAPDASKEIAKNSAEIKNDKPNITKYIVNKILYNGMLNTIRIKPRASKIAIPIETTIRIIDYDISPEVTNSTCPAKICRSGSATDTKNPRSNPANATIQIFLLFTIVVPIKEPIGVIPISTPTNSTASPIIISSPPNKNLPNTIGSRGVNVKFKITTINVIGKTENNASLIFSTSAFNSFSLPSENFELLNNL